MTRPWIARGAGVVAMVALAAGAAAQHEGESFRATASVSRGEVRASAPTTITIARYSSADDRAALVSALRDGGAAAARRTLAAFTDVGVIGLGETRTPIKFAAARPTAGGRIITIVTADPVLFLGGGLPEGRPRQGHEVAVAMLEVGETGGGLGELAPAATIGLSQDGALLVDDYGATVIWLQGLTRER